jgi:glucose-1-phosphate adenylyltransferase
MTPETLARQQLPKKALALILAGGRGSRLKQLTDRRAKPAVYFGGKFRIIDFALSNCLNSGIRRLGVLTQYKSHSLLRHMQRGWAFLKPELNEFVDLLPAQQRIDEESWYRGTADAVFQNLDIIQSNAPEYIVILAGDHIYKMDYSVMLAHHVARGAECSVGCIEVPLAEASAFGVMAVDKENRITEFLEKPTNPPALSGRPDTALASMGIYIFNANFLYAELKRDLADPASSHDFGKDIIPRAVSLGCAVAQPFGLSCVGTEPGRTHYWRDVGTIDAYWDANIDLTATQPELNLYDHSWPIWTYQEQLPPAKFVHNQADRRGMAIESSVSGGCIISGAVHRSLLFSKCRVHSWSTVNWSVLLPGVEVGRHARLTRVIADRGCHIPDGLVVGEDAEDDARRFYRSESGITLITREMLEQLDH